MVLVGGGEMEQQTIKLRVGLLVDSLGVAEWAYHALDQAIQNGHIEISAIIICVPSRRPESFLPKLIRKRPLKALAEMAYTLLEKPISNSSSFEERDIRGIAPQALILEVTPDAGKSTDTIRPADVEKIQKLELDILLRRGFRLLRGDILRVGARYGVWSFHHGDNRINRGGPPAFWEFAGQWPEVGATLQILTEELDGGLVLGRATCRVRGARTWTDLRNSISRKAAKLLVKWFRVFSVRQAEALKMVQKQQPAFSIYDRPLYRRPGTCVIVRLLCRLLRKVIFAGVKRTIRRFQRPSRRRPAWGLLYHFCDTSSGPLVLTLRKFKKLCSPRGVFWADPFLAEKNEKVTLFFEEYNYAAKKGSICAAELTADGLATPPQKVLEEDWHLSYPFVFEYEDRLYMIPESGCGEVRLYECIGSPYEWRFHSVLLEDVNAVDTTLAEQDGEWWLFTSMCTNGYLPDSAELHLYYAPMPFGPWQPHLLNPINSSVRSARPAGSLIARNGKLYRLGQDGVEYGKGIRICEIIALTHQEYEEVEVERIEAKWGDVKGIHTLNMSASCIVADYKA